MNHQPFMNITKMVEPFMNNITKNQPFSYMSYILLLLNLLLVLVLFFIISALIMVTYNNSITKMNNNWKTIDYKDAMVFTLFLLFVGGVFSSAVYIR